jgi:hypothetical protein
MIDLGALVVLMCFGAGCGMLQGTCDLCFSNVEGLTLAPLPCLTAIQAAHRQLNSTRLNHAVLIPSLDA